MELVKKILDWSCIVCTIIFFLSVTVLILGQAAAVITMNGEMAVGLSEMIAEPASMVSALATIIAIVLAYLRGQMKS